MLPPSDFRACPSYPGYFANVHGRVWSTRGGKSRELHPAPEKGYLRLSVILNGRRVRRGAHQLVADAFHGPCPDGQEVRHLDGDRAHNAAENLAYGTSSQNRLDTVRLGRDPNARKTHCKRGHEFTPENTRLSPLRNGSVARVCRKCDTAKQLAYQARRRAGALA